MNTALDMLFVSPFVALLVPGIRWTFWWCVVAALLLAEFFSPFAFGLETLALLGGWLFVRAMITFIDTSSMVSVVIAFVTGIVVEVALITTFFVFEHGTLTSALALRGGVFALRQFLAGLFVFALIMGLRAAYAVGIYAMAEEKNPFA